MIRSSCAASRASAICLAIDSNPSIVSGFHSISLFNAVDDRDVGIVQRRKDLCFSLEPSGRRSGSAANASGTTFKSIVRFERRVVRSPDPDDATLPRRAVTS
jgi:hypothetical protein